MAVAVKKILSEQHASIGRVAGHFYVKSDIYGFGGVLLEMLSGRQVFDANQPSGDQYLVHWAKSLLSHHNKLNRVMDPGLLGQYPYRGALQAADLILRCLNDEHKSRPSMDEVVETLEQIDAVKKDTDSQPSSSQTKTCNDG